MTEDPFARAVERVEATERAAKTEQRERRQEMWSEGNRTAFRTHATVYLMVNLLLVVIWLTTTGSSSFAWPLYVIIAWGAGLAAHWSAASRHLRRGRERDARRAAPAAPVAVAPIHPAPAPAPIPAPAPAPSTSEELERLAGLHRSGVLSDEEFSQAKAKLLS